MHEGQGCMGRVGGAKEGDHAHRTIRPVGLKHPFLDVRNTMDGRQPRREDRADLQMLGRCWFVRRGAMLMLL